ncbi:MAG TPA: tetratricopeptide repeat protein [Steroidobacteraceae bacterium]
MTQGSSKFAHWFAELRRRKVVRVAVVYVLIAWVLIQIADATFDPIGLPGWAHRLVIVLTVLGFPLACGLAWAFDVTPRGIERTAAPGPGSPAVKPGVSADPATPPVVAAAPLAATAWLAPQPTAASDSPTASALQPSVAILPFADMSPAGDQAYFCDGIAEEIINALCCVRGLQVASRTSSFQFKGRSADVREIGRSLGVSAVLEGSVRRSAERARITAQLVSSDDGFHLWSQSFDRGLEDIFATQSEIAQNIVRALRSSLTTEEAALIERGGTRNPQAYEYYLRARQLHNEHSDTTIKQAIELFRRAVQADPEFAKAHAGLAMALASAIFWRMVVEPGAMEDAMRAAKRAAELAPDLPEAWLAQGNLYSASLRSAEADRAFEKALEGNPESFEVLLLYARHAFSAGQTAKSVDLFERAQRLEPEDYQVAALLAGSVRKLGDLERALSADRAAIALLERRIELYPDDTRALHLAAGVYAKLGQRERALAVAERALALRPREFATLYNVACAYAQLGEKERALAILEAFGEHGQGSFDWIREDPDFASLHGDPRFERVVAHLSDVSKAAGTS